MKQFLLALIVLVSVTASASAHGRHHWRYGEYRWCAYPRYHHYDYRYSYPRYYYRPRHYEFRFEDFGM